MDLHNEPYPGSVVEDAAGRLWENVAETHRPGRRNWRLEGQRPGRDSGLETWATVNSFAPLRGRFLLWRQIGQ